ncbi:hypothetical protein ANCCEY_10055 [Ancylostoma ceylanicum]|uniref:Uncharacterized protein n=1 Tax=Ancylostoma ceylanicum TaxID=53326 RepID=A0A0D6LFW3_9BILA|nr:hypothetical protein ANCCEY_10055 [Ancylostoma ceylanicum]
MGHSLRTKQDEEHALEYNKKPTQHLSYIDNQPTTKLIPSDSTMLPFLIALLIIPPVVKPLTVAEYLARPKSEDAAKLDGKAFVDYINQQQSFFRRETVLRAAAENVKILQAEYSPDAEEFVRNRIMDVKFAVDPEKTEPNYVLANTEMKVDIPDT